VAARRRRRPRRHQTGMCRSGRVALRSQLTLPRSCSRRRRSRADAHPSWLACTASPGMPCHSARYSGSAEFWLLVESKVGFYCIRYPMRSIGLTVLAVAPTGLLQWQARWTTASARSASTTLWRWPSINAGTSFVLTASVRCAFDPATAVVKQSSNACAATSLSLVACVQRQRFRLLLTAVKLRVCLPCHCSMIH